MLMDLVLKVAALLPAAGGASDITTYFQNLFNNGIKPVSYAVAVFFFSWGAIELMFPNERSQDRGKAALYRALAGLVLILLTTAIATIFSQAGSPGSSGTSGTW